MKLTTFTASSRVDFNFPRIFFCCQRFSMYAAMSPFDVWYYSLDLCLETVLLARHCRNPISTDSYTLWPSNFIGSYEIIQTIKNTLTSSMCRQWLAKEKIFTNCTIKFISYECKQISTVRHPYFHLVVNNNMDLLKHFLTSEGSSISHFTVVFDNGIRSKLFETLSPCILEAIALAQVKSVPLLLCVVFHFLPLKETRHTKQTQHSFHHLSGEPLRGGCTWTPNGVGPNRPHLSFCSAPFGLEQRTLGIASVPQGTKQFIALDGERACSARQAEAKTTTTTTTHPVAIFSITFCLESCSCPLLWKYSTGLLVCSLCFVSKCRRSLTGFII